MSRRLSGGAPLSSSCIDANDGKGLLRIGRLVWVGGLGNFPFVRFSGGVKGASWGRIFGEGDSERFVE